MLWNKNNLAVAKIASKSENKPEIAGVLFKSDRTVATDSFRLIEITTPTDVKPEDFPVVDGKAAMRGCSPFIVPAKSVREIKIPKVKNGLSITANVAIKHLDNKQVEFLTTDLETAKITTVRRVEGKFPDYLKLFPQGNPKAEITLNGEFLKELLDIMCKINKEIKIKIYGEDKAIVLEAVSKIQTSKALFMPIKK